MPGLKLTFGPGLMSLATLLMVSESQPGRLLIVVLPDAQQQGDKEYASACA